MEISEPFPELTANAMMSHPKKTWSQLLQHVKQSRTLQSNLTSKVPIWLTFYQHEDKRRLYFLGVPHGKKDSTLMYTDITASGGVMPWKPVLYNPDMEDEMDMVLSKEEQLLQERKRSSLKGITSFILDSQSNRIVYPANSKLHSCMIDPQLNEPTAPTQLNTQSNGSKLDPKFCPYDPDLLAYIANGDIWVYDLYANTDHRVTHSKKGTGSVVDDPISSGIPSYIIQEEFDRLTGYYWQPTEHDMDGVSRILYEEVDESDVDIINVVSPTGESSGVEQYRYPRPGTNNSQCRLRVAEIYRNSGSATEGTQSRTSAILDLYCDLKVLYPWLEYIVRFGWLPDGQSVWAQILSRNQQRLALVFIPLAYFVHDKGQQVASPQTVLEETSHIWINVGNCFHILQSDSREEVRFIWASERSGNAHLYLYSYNLASRTTSSPVTVTSGEWQVNLSSRLSVDNKRDLVYFMANKDTPLESHLYCAPLSGGAITRLTEPGYNHQIDISPDCSLLISTYSSIETNPVSKLYQLQHDGATGVHLRHVNTILDHTELDAQYRPPQIFQCPLPDEKLPMYGMVYKPHNYIPGRKYPTLLFVYGGPHVQLVTNANKALRLLRLHTLASLGYAVVCMDGRGSLGRGLAWESALKNRMGMVEMADQVHGLKWLAENVDYIDLTRVAIHGWSYGGYMSLMGLLQFPDIFKVSISCAPVTQWEYYDTGYTERYMSTPSNNSDGYKNGSVLSYMDKFPDTENRLMIVHGMIDENVHLVHTTALVNELLKSCKPHRLQLYPNERHGIRNPEANQHFETLVLSFLQDHL